MKRKNYKSNASKYFMLLLILFVCLYNSRTSLAFDRVEAARETELRVVSNEKAFIGIDCQKHYKVKPGENIKFFIRNNFPYDVECKLDFEEDQVSKYTPEEFSLESHNGKQEIKVEIGEEVEPGEYEIEGNVLAEFEDGSSDINFTLDIEVEQPDIKEKEQSVIDLNGNVPILYPQSVPVVVEVKCKSN